jgi:hypothetical protein
LGKVHMEDRERSENDIKMNLRKVSCENERQLEVT